MESEDGANWHFVTELDASRGELGRMWECPDFFDMDGQQVMLVSPQEMQATPDGVFHAGFGTIALLGTMTRKTIALHDAMCKLWMTVLISMPCKRLSLRMEDAS